jgi:ribonuclease BN (tRNA processing enzyme)
MKIRVLGCHHTETADTRLSSLLIDDHVALDAGALTSTLSMEEQARVTTVLITHHHYDHVRDLLTLALGRYESGDTVSVFSTAETLDYLQANLLNGRLYPDFTRVPTPPRLQPVALEVDRLHEVAGLAVTPVRAQHSVPAVGYRIRSGEGREVFCTGDTGGGFGQTLGRARPDLLITEVTFSNDQESFARLTYHMTPKLLEEELRPLVAAGNAPQSVLVVHMNTAAEPRIREEVSAVAERLHIPIAIAHEGMVLNV